MNITEIATATVDRLEPSLKRMIDSHESATHPEIVNGRKGMIEKRERMIETVSLAITDAVVADRMCSELRHRNYEHALTEICVMTAPHTPRELCTTAEAVEWLVDRHKAANAALHKLEEIRTEKLAAKGLTVEASAVSAARVILQSKRIADEKADGKPDGQAENVEPIHGEKNA
jgi:hypothetical protein